MAQREELILDVTAKLDQALRDIQALQSQLDALATGTEVTVAAAVQGSEDIEALAATTAELDGTEASVTLGADDEASDVVGDVADEIDDLDGASAEVELEADDEATDAVEDVTDAVDELDGQTAEVTVEADTDEAVSGLDDVASGLEGVTAAGVGLKGLAGAGGIGGLTTALLGAASAGIEYINQVEQLSLATGAASEESSRLLAVIQNYTTIDAGRLESSIGRLADKLASTPELAEQLNIDAALPPLELFVQTVDALNSGQLDATERIQTGIDLFGRGGLKVVNEIAASLSGPLAGAMDEIEGKQIVGDDDIANADELEASMGQLKAQIGEVSVALGEQLIPALVLFADTAASPGVRSALEVWAGKLLNPIAEVQRGIDAIKHLTEGDDIVPEFDPATMGPFVSEMGTVRDVTEEATEGMISYEEALRLGKQAGRSFAAEQDRMSFTAEELGDALLAMQDPMETLPFLWDILIKKYREGTLESGTALDAINQLAEATGRAPEEVLALVAAESELRDQNLAQQLEKDAAAALELAEAMAELKDTMGEIDTDDLANISGALAEALDVGGMAVNLQIEEAEVRGQVDEIAGKIQEFVDEHGAVDWSVVLDPTKSAEGFDAGLAGMIGSLQEQLQTGIVNAFESGGVDAAMGFVNEFMPQLRALGMDTAQIREFLGIPEDGNIPVFLQVMIDAEAKADALAILDSLIGVDPNNPAIAYLRLAVQADTVPAQVAEVAARILASEATGLPIKLEDFTQEDIDAALAILEGYDVTVPVMADATAADGTISDVEQGDYQATIDGVADTAQAAQQLLDEASRHRTATIYALADFVAAKTVLDGLMARRTANVYAVAHTREAEQDLNHTARRRDAYIYTHTVGAGGGGGGGGGGGAEAGTLAAPLAVGPTAMTTATGVGVSTLAAPMSSSVPSSGVAVVAAAPTVNNNYVTVQAGIIGNKNEMDRIISRSLRRHVRLNGSRN